MYKTLLSGLLAVFVSFGLSACKGEEKIVVATDTGFVPFKFKEGSEYKGVRMRLLNDLVKHWKLKIWSLMRL